MQVTLPWPDSALVPHAGGSKWPKIRATKAARKLAYEETCAQLGRARLNLKYCVDKGRLQATVTLHQPDKRRRDVPNWQAACKASIDGVSDAIGIDDYHWDVNWRNGEPIKGGQVVVNIEVANTAEVRK